MGFCTRLARFTSALFILILASTLHPAFAQSPQPLITRPINESRLTSLRGSVSARIAHAQDLGSVDASQPSGRLLLLLKRSAAQESALQTFLHQAHQPGSPAFHQWLTPAAFGQQFGAAPSDIEQLTAWLQSHGLTVARVATGGNAIEFSGTIAQVSAALHTSIHTYNVNGETHHANATEAQIPEALADIVAGVSQLDDFKPKPLVKLLGQAIYNPKTHQGKPTANWTYPQGTGNPPFYFLAPEDITKQYDVAPVYAAGINGAGQTIGIINDSNIDINLVNAYRALFKLPVNPPQVVVDGTDPGVNGDAFEAYIDVENAGSIAPNATVKLYVAGSFGLLGDGGLTFSLLRAVNDDAASVLSLSFGGPESLNGPSFSAFINSLWEQAAAQGQTVFVSSGDSGSFDGYDGIGVNSFASTPWNIAVGGTDIYLADYATGGDSITSFWSNANDASLGSLQKSFPEQPWNGSNYGLNSITYDPVAVQPYQTDAGGGGASSCALTGSAPNTCVGFPKPSWQAGAGVPNDGVRDLPDVSLFASNGYNGVLWPFCAEAGDCTETDPLFNATYISGAGGTSTSAPAMAGFMALIDQKYGPQGQANYVLYPLAQQFPSAFYPITVGSNNVPCNSYEVGCTLDPSGTGYSFQRYYATAGFDLASGLGSLDVNQIFTNWSKVAFNASATTLTLSPTTITHGQAVTATATVTGKGTPAGAVALVTSSPLANNKSADYIELAAGTGTASINNLPGGTYTVTGDYSGDGINAASASQPVTVTVAPETSTLQFNPQYISAATGKITPITAGSSVPYDSAVLMDVTVTGAAGAFDGAATGSLTFTDSGNTLAVVPISAAGTAEFNASSLAVGSHTIAVSYAGDASFKASTASAVQFNIVKAATSIFAEADASGFRGSNNTLHYGAGQNANLTFLVGPSVIDGGACPTGSLSVQFGSASATSAALSPCENLSNAGVYSTATDLIASLQAGTYTLTLSYPGDANYLAATQVYTVLVSASSQIPSSTTLTTSPSNLAGISPSTIITATATVSGNGQTTPNGSVTFSLGNVLSFYPVNLQPASSGTSATATLTIRAADLPPGPNQFIATYTGDNTYAPSSSTTTIIPDDPSDFTFAAANSNIAISSGKSGSTTLTLGSLNGFAGSVTLACTAPASLVCSLPSSSVSLTANGNATATVNINAYVTSGSLDLRTFPFKTVAAPFLACLFLILVPNRRRTARMLFALLACVAIGSTTGCFNYTRSGTSPAGGTTNAKPGTYTVLITATIPNGVIHNQSITVVVQ